MELYNIFGGMLLLLNLTLVRCFHLMHFAVVYLYCCIVAQCMNMPQFIYLCWTFFFSILDCGFIMPLQMFLYFVSFGLTFVCISDGCVYIYVGSKHLLCSTVVDNVKQSSKIYQFTFLVTVFLIVIKM